MASGLLGVHGRRATRMAAHSLPAHPVPVQCGVRLTRAAPYPWSTLVQIEGLWAFYPVRDGPPQLLGQQRHRFALAVFLLQAGRVPLAGGSVAENEHCRFREGPRAIRLADLGPCGPVAWARRVFGPRDEAARGANILDP
jgi:hypothetical protein